MRTPWPPLLLFLCVLAPACVSAQQAPSDPTSTSSTPLTQSVPVRDPQAVALVQQSLAAMGAQAASTILNAQVQGALVPATNSDVPSGTFSWLDDFSGSTYEFRHELDTAEAVRVEVSGHGSPAGAIAPIKPLQAGPATRSTSRLITTTASRARPINTTRPAT